MIDSVAVTVAATMAMELFDVTQWFWEMELKPLYVYTGCSNHTYSEQYGEQIHVTPQKFKFWNTTKIH
jgi:hypothetical protein